MANKLPNSWKEVSFTEVFDINGGTQPPKSQFISEPKEGYIRLLQIRDFGKKPVPTYIPNTGKLRTCEKEDILIARYGASIGRIVSNQEGAYNVALAKVNIPNLMNKNFVKWLLKSHIFQNKITSFQRTAQSGFNKNDLSNINIPLPPLKEQQRIVAKLDTLFTHLEVLNTRLANIPKLLKNFKQAVLTQAVMGKLTEEWRVGKELDEWEEKALQDITTKIGSGSTPRGGSENYKEEGIPLVRSMNIHFNGIKLKGLAFIDEVQAERLKNVIIEENDILLNITGASIGRVCIAEEDVIGGRVNQHVTIIRLSECHSSEYINMYLASSIIQNYIFNENYGVTRQALTKTQTQNLEINLPPQEEQTEIVKRVENLFTKADKIEAQYKILKAKTESLPQAILAKAFKGELVEQLDTDGSAKELLAEIQKLKAAVIPKKKTKKKVKV